MKEKETTIKYNDDTYISMSVYNYKIMCKDKEIERLKEENEVLNGILETQRKRKYYSKFLKDFQKENGKNVFPDFDEIYKRYDDYKERNHKAIEYINYYTIEHSFEDFKSMSLNDDELTELLKILKGDSNDIK